MIVILRQGDYLGYAIYNSRLVKHKLLASERAVSQSDPSLTWHIWGYIQIVTFA